MNCPECMGAGYVSWFYEDEMGNEYEKEMDCPVCEGFSITIEELRSLPGWEDYSDDTDDEDEEDEEE